MSIMGSPKDVKNLIVWGTELLKKLLDKRSESHAPTTPYRCSERISSKGRVKVEKIRSCI